MNEDLKQIIESSNFEVVPGTFVYIKAKSVPQGKHFLITQDQDEITVVTIEDRVAEVDMIERNKDNYTLIALNVSVPFYCVGFLSVISEAVAKEGMNILVVSTYSKDYIMVKQDCTEKAAKVLKELGFKE